MYTDLVFFLLPFSLSSLLCPPLPLCFKTPSPQLLPTDCTPHDQLFPLSSSPLCHSSVTTTQPFLPNSLSPIWTPPTNWKRNKNTTLASHFAIICPFAIFLSSTSSLFFLLSHALFKSSTPSPLVLSSFSSSLMPLLPPWYCGLPVDLAACGLRTCPDSTPLSSAPSLFPCPLFPIPLWPPAPLLPLLSLKSVTPHCLFILFGTLSSFHLLFYYYCYLARWACLVSCCWLCFFNHWWLIIRLQGYEGWGCLFVLGFVWPVLVVVGLCEQSKARTPHKAAAFHL